MSYSFIKAGIGLAGDGSYILIVDDLPEICELLADVFIMNGYQAKTALSGDQAICAIRVHKPSLIIMDINMPGKDGLATLREARDLISSVPVIIVTAYAEMDEVLEARKRGLIDYFIPKPFDITTLVRLVNRTIDPESSKKKAAGF